MADSTHHCFYCDRKIKKTKENYRIDGAIATHIGICPKVRKSRKK